MLKSLASLSLSLATIFSAGTANSGETVLLEGLNKTTGRVVKLEIVVGTTITWGDVNISPKRCFKAPPEQLPENAAFLEISEAANTNTFEPLFKGWMFSSSPSLSSLEHPVYDIIVLECSSNSPASPKTDVVVEPLPPVDANN